jgi:hypothetical protein
MEFRFNDNISVDDAMKMFNMNEYRSMTYEKIRTEMPTQVNKKLKEIKTFDEFVVFIKAMESLVGGMYHLYSKRRGYYIYDFERDKYDLDVIHYLYDDNHSVGKSQIRNLYRYFTCEVR